MSKIESRNLEDDVDRIMIDEAVLQARILEVAKQIEMDYAEKMTCC